jgi:dTMP kinase
MTSQGGLFLAFEGVEGSGKSTQAGLLAERLRLAGFDVTLAREPGSTPLGERVRRLVLDETTVAIPARSELYLMLAARAAFVEQVVRPGIAAGRIVIADRFELSTLAYQGAGRGLQLDEVIRSNRFATGGLSPDATILLQLSAEEGLRRQIAAAKKPDRMETEARDFHRRVGLAYDEWADKVDGLLRIDAAGSIGEVEGRVLAALERRFPETFHHAGFIR